MTPDTGQNQRLKNKYRISNIEYRKIPGTGFQFRILVKNSTQISNNKNIFSK